MPVVRLDLHTYTGETSRRGINAKLKGIELLLFPLFPPPNTVVFPN